MSCMEYETEIAVGANERLTMGRGRIIAGKAWRASKIALNALLPENPDKSGAYQVYIETPKGSRMDIDSPIKFFLDAMQGKWFENDKQVKRLYVSYGNRKNWLLRCEKIEKENKEK